MKVSLVELLAVLEEYKGAVFASVTTDTEPKTLAKSRVTGEPTPNIRHESYRRIMLATNYENNVKAQREREGHESPDSFQAESLWKGKGRRFGRFLVVHEDKPDQFYLRIRPQADEHGRPVAIKSKWLRDGAEVNQDELAEFLPKPRPASKQELTKEIPYRAYKVENIKTLTIGGVTYELDHEADKPEWATA